MKVMDDQIQEDVGVARAKQQAVVKVAVWVEVEVAYSLFLLYELEVGEEQELHVVVQDLQANDYIGEANLYI